MDVTIAALLTAKAYVWTGPGIEAAGVRLTPKMYEGLLRAVDVRTAYPDPLGMPSLTGLAVHVDRYLAAGVWRLTAADGSLLYDSRQGRKGNEW